MGQQNSEEYIHTSIWDEEPEKDNPFLAKACYCAGYDVYGELLNKASWPEYLFLLLKSKRPTDTQSRLLERVMISIANPGPREQSVQAAMAAAAGGSTAASTLMAALAVGAGQIGGAREIYLAMQAWVDVGQDIEQWIEHLSTPSKSTETQAWPQREYPAGFEPYGVTSATPVQQVLACLSDIFPAGTLAWLKLNRVTMEKAAKRPLAMTGVIAAAFVDLTFTPQEGEMLYLLLRLPGAAAHALEQYMQWKRYPFHKDGLVLLNDPGLKI